MRTVYIINGHMKSREDNLKDEGGSIGIVIKDIAVSISYTKTNKLITGLYMVTDIIDKDEPLRVRLRTLGAGILSDIHQIPHLASPKIAELMSFLDLAKTLHIISPMNCEILEKEFMALYQSLKESMSQTDRFNQQLDLAEFFQKELPPYSQNTETIEKIPIGHKGQTRIGVQRGNTLMKALSDKTLGMSDRRVKRNNDSFDILKKDRRAEILHFIKNSAGGATITDIKNGAGPKVASCGEKTLQRELVSMVKEGLLRKAGEKRWSRYYLSAN